MSFSGNIVEYKFHIATTQGYINVMTITDTLRVSEGPGRPHTSLNSPLLGAIAPGILAIDRYTTN
ncbi:hypothetical protein [Vibrio sp. RC27]